MNDLEPVNTVFGPFQRDPLDGLAREMRQALADLVRDGGDVPAGKVIQGEVVRDSDPTPAQSSSVSRASVSRM